MKWTENAWEKCPFGGLLQKSSFPGSAVPGDPIDCKGKAVLPHPVSVPFRSLQKLCILCESE